MAAQRNAPITINRVRIQCHPECADDTHQGGSFLTLRRGYSPTDSRFSEASTPAPPRRLCPSRSMFLAALWSRCRLVPQSGQLCQRTDKPFDTMTPQPEHLWLVNAGLTACTRFPAPTAL